MSWFINLLFRKSNFNNTSSLKKDGYYFFKEGVICLRRREIGNALKFFDSSIENHYLQYQVFYHRAECLSSLGYYLESIEDYNKAVEINSFIANIFYGRHFAKTAVGDLVGALNDLQEAIRVSKINNDNSMYWNSYAKDTGYTSTTERYEYDLVNYNMLIELYQEQELCNIPEIKEKIEKRNLEYEINKRRRRF